MFKSINPATGQTFATYDEIDAAEIERRLKMAAERYQSWRTTALDERVKLLSAIADQFDENKQRIAEMAVREMGKTIASALAEVEKCASGFRYYAEHGPSFLNGESVALGGGTAQIHWLPIGPVLAVMPWNFPYWQVVRFLAPAIMAGNVGLLKHASNVQGCAALIEEMVLAAGAPDGLFQNLAIKSDKVAGMIADDRVRAVTLTGSEGAGEKVAEAAGKALKKVVLELGGSDPFIVMPSADIEKAAEVAVTARLQNAGQSCICAKRMIVHEAVYDAFLDQFSSKMKAFRVGDPMDRNTQMGPLSSMEQRDTVLDQVKRATSKGARLLFGAEPADPGAYLSPAILVDVPHDSDVAKEEMFGPVAMLFRVPDIDAAVRLANDTPFGLGASVWTNDKDELARFSRDVESGMMAVNQMLASTPEAPFGGVKRSGHGRELGPWGMHEFMNQKSVMLTD